MRLLQGCCPMQEREPSAINAVFNLLKGVLPSLECYTRLLCKTAKFGKICECKLAWWTNKSSGIKSTSKGCPHTMLHCQSTRWKLHRSTGSANIVRAIATKWYQTRHDVISRHVVYCMVPACNLVMAEASNQEKQSCAS